MASGSYSHARRDGSGGGQPTGCPNGRGQDRPVWPAQRSRAQAAKELAANGIGTTVVNARFAKPLDSKLITDLARRIKRIITVEENVLSGGLGSSVVNLLQESAIRDLQVKCIGLRDEFIDQGTQTFLRSKYGLDGKGIAQQVLTLFPVTEQAETA